MPVTERSTLCPSSVYMALCPSSVYMALCPSLRDRSMPVVEGQVYARRCGAGYARCGASYARCGACFPKE